MTLTTAEKILSASSAVGEQQQIEHGQIQVKMPQNGSNEQFASSSSSAEWGLFDGLDINSAILDKLNLNCIHIGEAITAQGISDLTSYTAVQVGISIVYALLLLFGLFSNGSVLLAFAHNRRLRSSRNFFLLNLILTDILLCLTAIPITPWYAMTKDWTFGPILCRLVPLCNSCAVFVTSWSLTAIAFDKYMHIVVEPTRRHFSRQLAGFVTFCVWFGSLVVNIPYLMSFELVDGFYVISDDHFTRFCGKFCDEFNWASEGQRRFYGVIVLLFQFIVPMAVITFCHMRILRKVQADMIIQNAQFRKTLTSSQRTDAISRKKRVNYTLLGMVVAFVGCNVPLTAVNLAKDFGQEPEFLLKQPYLCPLIAHFIAMTIVVWNPLLFFWLSAKDKSRGSSANGQLMSVGGSDHHGSGNGGTNANANNLTISNVLRRWSRSDLPSSSSTIFANGANLLSARKEPISATRSHQMLTGHYNSGGGGSLRGRENKRLNQVLESMRPKCHQEKPLVLIRQHQQREGNWPGTQPNDWNGNETNNNNEQQQLTSRNLLSAQHHNGLMKSGSIRSNLF